MKNDWIKRFEKKFTRKSMGGPKKGQYIDYWFVRETTSEELKAFIAHELDVARDEEKERVIENLMNSLSKKKGK